MDLVCFICYEGGDSLIDPHCGSKPKHVFHQGCYSSWEKASKVTVSHCPYCMESVRPNLHISVRNAERKPVIAAIRSRNLELFNSLLSSQEKLDDESRHIYLVEATIVGATSFLEFIEEKYSLPYEDLIPFLAITLSMKNRKLYQWYWRSYNKRRLYSYASYRRCRFECQVLVAAEMVNKKWLNRWLLFKTALKSEAAQSIPKNAIIYATKFGRSESTLRRADSFFGRCITEKEYLEYIVPQVFTDEIGWKQSYWFGPSSSTVVLSSGLRLAVASVNWKACEYIFRITTLYSMRGRFKTIDVQHLFSFRGRLSGIKIFRKLCINQLVDLDDLRKHKIHLCKLSYQASNDELMKYFWSVLQEWLTGKELEGIQSWAKMDKIIFNLELK